MKDLPPVGSKLVATMDFGSHAKEGDVFRVVASGTYSIYTGTYRFVSLDHCGCGEFHGRPGLNPIPDEYTWTWDFCSEYFELVEPEITPEEAAQARSLPSPDEALEFVRRESCRG
jgi:hypothetical protein